SAGTFTIVATLTDSFGNVITARSAVSVIAAPAPTIVITPTLPASCSPAPSAIVNLQIQVSVPTGIGVVSVTGNFGDGTSSNLGGLTGTTTIPHPYACGVNPTVTVSVTDTTTRPPTTGTTSFKMPS